MTTMLDRLFSAPSGSLLSRLSARGRRRQALIDVRELPAHVQRDIGLCDGLEAMTERMARRPAGEPVMPAAAPMRCAFR